MERRTFLKSGLIAGTASLAGASTALASGHTREPARFNMKFSPEFGIFADLAGKDIVDQIKWGYDQGFSSMEMSLRRVARNSHTVTFQPSLTSAERLCNRMHLEIMPGNEKIALKTLISVSLRSTLSPDN